MFLLYKKYYSYCLKNLSAFAWGAVFSLVCGGEATPLVSVKFNVNKS